MHPDERRDTRHLKNLVYAQETQGPESALRIEGKRPEDYPWMYKGPEEMASYQQCYERIDAVNREHGREVVRLDPHGDDRAQWYRGIEYGLSVSDHESFHLTRPDVVASGRVPFAQLGTILRAEN